MCHFLLDNAADTKHLEHFDEVEAWETAHEDWANDTQGLPALHFDYFLQSVFELADLWTQTIEEKDYIFFLKRLVQETTKPTKKKGVRQWAYAWPRDYQPPHHTDKHEEARAIERRAAAAQRDAAAKIQALARGNRQRTNEEGAMGPEAAKRLSRARAAIAPLTPVSPAEVLAKYGAGGGGGGGGGAGGEKRAVSGSSRSDDAAYHHHHRPSPRTAKPAAAAAGSGGGGGGGCGGGCGSTTAAQPARAIRRFESFAVKGDDSAHHHHHRPAAAAASLQTFSEDDESFGGRDSPTHQRHHHHHHASRDGGDDSDGGGGGGPGRTAGGARSPVASVVDLVAVAGGQRQHFDSGPDAMRPSSCRRSRPSSSRRAPSPWATGSDRDGSVAGGGGGGGGGAAGGCAGSQAELNSTMLKAEWLIGSEAPPMSRKMRKQPVGLGGATPRATTPRGRAVGAAGGGGGGRAAAGGADAASLGGEWIGVGCACSYAGRDGAAAS